MLFHVYVVVGSVSLQDTTCAVAEPVLVAIGAYLSVSESLALLHAFFHVSLTTASGARACFLFDRVFVHLFVLVVSRLS